MTNANYPFDIPEAVALDDERGAVIILDQTKLPGITEYRALTDAQAIRDAIYRLCVRGAPAIGIAAALGIYICVKDADVPDVASLKGAFAVYKKYLATARPTAVNLCWALDEMERALFAAVARGEDVAQIKKSLRDAAIKIKQDDINICRAIGEHGMTLLSPDDGILTHCNAGSLATARYGTALAPIYVAKEQGVSVRVYADETRPLLQGARLTAYELQRAGVDITLICDNMASIVMQRGLVNKVFVGCDRVAQNGDTANKIGTSGVAILAAAYGIPFYVCAPLSTVDLLCQTGSDIVIEERDDEEITHLWYDRPVAPPDIKVFNPAFDVTDARYITAFVTERGIIRPPFDVGLRAAKAPIQD